jgi:hypothetical protein
VLARVLVLQSVPCPANPCGEYHPRMNQDTASATSHLKNIARRAMLERELLPDFSPAVLAEADAISRVCYSDVHPPGKTPQNNIGKVAA